MEKELANAFPRKNFFIQMFTRDISLEDCILDLIDNSVDGLVRSRRLSPVDVAGTIFSGHKRKRTARRIGQINVSYSDQAVVIKDNCGGIDWNYALDEAFAFGHGPDWHEGYLGVYGVGLKRALFKIGNEFYMRSRTTENGFTCRLKVSDWLQRDEAVEDWTIPLTREPGADSAHPAGTTIRIRALHDEVKARLGDGTFDTSLCKSISRTYCFFLGKHVQISVNRRPVQRFVIPVGKPRRGSVSFDKFERDGVTIRIVTTIAERGASGRLREDVAGWYVACNGRLVLAADRSDVSGWGVPGLMPRYQPKYRGFIGLVFFESKDPLRLPWTTTKSSLNRESPVYLEVRSRMWKAAKPVISFLNREYPSDLDGIPIERKIAKEVERTSLADVVAKGPTVWQTVRPTKKPVRTTTRVQYDAENLHLRSIREHLRRSRLSASAIGRYTFEYYLDQEGLR